MINAAVAGFGWWGRQIVRSLARSEEIRVVRAVDPDRNAHAAFAVEHGLPPLSARLDCLVPG